MSANNNESYLKFPHRGSNEGNVSKACKFLLTNRGRGVVRFAVGTVTFSLSAALFLKETYFIENYIDIIRFYRHGFPLKVPDEWKAKIDVCLSKAKFDGQETNFVKSFMLNGFDTLSVGSIKSGFGGYIGIPGNYLYEMTDDVDKIDLKVNGRESINWNSKYGQLLENSLVLTEDEKEFGLLRAIFELRNSNYIHRSLIPFGSICALYFLSQKINQHMDLYQRPRSIRLIVYTVFGTIIYGIYSVLTDGIRIRQDTKVDKSLAELGPEICETGVRFYEKLMNKNVAIRELSGNHSTYTVKGNENSGWFRWSKLALSTRKLYFKQMLDEARKKEVAADAEKTAEQSNEIDDKMKI